MHELKTIQFDDLTQDLHNAHLRRAADLGVNYDSLIILGYAAFTIVAIAALYFASGGPGVPEAELPITTLLP